LGRYQNGELFLKHSRLIQAPIIKMANFFRVIKMANIFYQNGELFQIYQNGELLRYQKGELFLSKWRTFFYQNGEFLSTLILKMANFSP
jgi:hypothetical protein